MAYAVYLHCVGLSFRQAAEAVSVFLGRSHEAIWLWYHEFGSFADVFHICYGKTVVVDERYVNVKGVGAWIWPAVVWRIHYHTRHHMRSTVHHAENQATSQTSSTPYKNPDENPNFTAPSRGKEELSTLKDILRSSRKQLVLRYAVRAALEARPRIQVMMNVNHKGICLADGFKNRIYRQDVHINCYSPI